jgi:hypothetical protein
MKPNAPTVIIYALASAAVSVLLISRNPYADVRWLALLALWLAACSLPLLFVFSLPRFLFADSAPRRRQNYAALFHGVGALSATVSFPLLALPFWKNPLYRLGDSIIVSLIPLFVLAVFLVGAISLLFRGKSSLTSLASVFLWPYWLLLALLSTGRFFQATPLEAVLYFLAFAAALLLAFAAGAVTRRPTLAHVAAAAGIICSPWIYSNVMKDSGLGNVWLMFNVPDNELMAYSTLKATILFVGLIALAVATAGLRLLPNHWLVWGSPIRYRTWPAAAISTAVLGVWFSQSVMPYRIPGALDLFDRPILQILHVQKHGLQFHERCVSVWGRAHDPVSASFSGNDRRLVQYRFRERSASGQLPQPLIERVRSMLPPQNQSRAEWDKVKPIRNWNADNWYFIAQGTGLKVYSAANGSAPPQEIVSLFDDLERLTQSSEMQSERKDVCLGFCYDPLSELGFLYANDRCFNNGHGTVCR